MPTSAGFFLPLLFSCIGDPPKRQVVLELHCIKLKNHNLEIKTIRIMTRFIPGLGSGDFRRKMKLLKLKQKYVSVVSKWRPLSFIFNWGNRENYGGWVTTVMLFLVKRSLVKIEARDGALDFALYLSRLFSVSVSLDTPYTIHAFFPECLFNHC
jgi:hypothetical protein